MEHPYLSLGSGIVMLYSRTPVRIRSWGSIPCFWCYVPGPIWGCYPPGLGSLISHLPSQGWKVIQGVLSILTGALVADSQFKAPCHLSYFCCHKPSWYSRLRHVVRRGYFHSAFVSELWIWNYLRPRLCLCPTDDLHYLGLETVRLYAFIDITHISWQNASIQLSEWSPNIRDVLNCRPVRQIRTGCSRRC